MSKNTRPNKSKVWVPTLADAIAAQLKIRGGGIGTGDKAKALLDDVDASDDPLSAAVRLALRTHGKGME